MNKILTIIFTSTLLYSIQGTIIFYDQTTIEGDINGIEKTSVYITPTGLTFPEQILLENIDSLKIDDGTIPIAGGKVLLLYENGEFFTPQEPGNNNSFNTPQQYAIEYVIVPNWSLNLYTGYPIIRGGSVQNEYYDKTNIIWGLSIGSPYGFFAGDFFMNAIGEIAYYKFEKIGNKSATFGGVCFQAGLSPGFFIGNTSFSATACTGLYRDDDQKFSAGFITGGSVDIPLGEIILEKYPDFEIFDDRYIKDFRQYIEAFELRFTGRSNIIQKVKGATFWIGAGLSFGYEF